QYFRYELLACKSRVYRHYDNDIKIVQAAIEPLWHRGTGVYRNSWTNACINQALLYFAELAFSACFSMHCDHITPCVDIILNLCKWIFNHKVGVKRQAGRCPQLPDRVGKECGVWNEPAVHHIKVDHVDPLPLDLLDLVFIVFALASDYGWRDKAFAVKFFKQHLSLSFWRSFAVPLRVVCHMAYTVALNGVCDYHDWFVVHSGGLVERIDDLLHPVTIHFKDLPVECCPLVLYGVKGHDVFCKAILLDTISVKYRNKVIQLELACGH